MGVVVDATTPGHPRVRLECSGCPSFGLSFPALPSTEVTVNKLLETASEHIARSHPDLVPLHPAPLLDVEVPERDSTHAIGPIR